MKFFHASAYVFFFSSHFYDWKLHSFLLSTRRTSVRVHWNQTSVWHGRSELWPIKMKRWPASFTTQLLVQLSTAAHRAKGFLNFNIPLILIFLTSTLHKMYKYICFLCFKTKLTVINTVNFYFIFLCFLQCERQA